MSLVQPGALNDYFVYGEALVDQGLVVGYAVDGLGLSTRGLIWTGMNIYYDVDAGSGISTSWTNTETPITTAWTPTESVITTTWTGSAGGMYGEYGP